MSVCYVKAYYDWIEQTAALSDAERGRLFIAVLEYARSGLEPKLDGREGILFPVFKATIDRDTKKSKTLAENGSLGGRGKKANKSKIKQNEANESKFKPTKEKEEDKRQKKKEEEIPPYPPKGDRSSGFEAFWESYPRKIRNGAAKEAWERLSPDKELIEMILAALEEQKDSTDWKEDNGRYIPSPEKWLNESRWNDKLKPQKENPYDFEGIHLPYGMEL